MCVSRKGERQDKGARADPFRIFDVDPVAIFNSSPMQHLTWSYLRLKIANGWKLLLSVAT